MNMNSARTVSVACWCKSPRFECKAHRVLNTDLVHGKESRGFTLIELLMTLILGSSLMLTSVGVVHRSFDVQRRTQDRLNRTRQIQRFIRQLQVDVHSCNSGHVTDSRHLTLTNAGSGEISYVFEDSVLSRTRPISSDDSRQLSDAPATAHVERIDLGGSRSARFEWQSDPQRVVFTITSSPEIGVGEDRVDRKVIIRAGVWPAAQHEVNSNEGN